LIVCAGGVIHSVGDSQDIRFMGGLLIYILLLLRVEWFLILLFVKQYSWLDFILRILFWRCFLWDMWIYLLFVVCFCWFKGLFSNTTGWMKLSKTSIWNLWLFGL